MWFRLMSWSPQAIPGHLIIMSLFLQFWYLWYCVLWPLAVVPQGPLVTRDNRWWLFTHWYLLGVAAIVLLVTRMDINDRRRLSPDEKNFKRRMKTPVQLEALERVYAGMPTTAFWCHQLPPYAFESLKVIQVQQCEIIHQFLERISATYLSPSSVWFRGPLPCRGS